MADDEKTIAQEAPEEEKAPAKSGGSSMKKYLVMGGIILTTAAVGYFVTLKFVKPMVSDGESAQTADADSEGAHETGDAKKENKRKKPKLNEHGEIESNIFEITDVIVNPAGTGGTRFLSVSVGFEVEYPETMKLFEARQPQIRDALITILGSKNIEQLTDMKQKEIARLQIKKRVESLLDTDELTAIYFTDFVIQ